MSKRAEYDIVIRNATIIDGSGEEPIDGDVAVKDGLIAAVGGHVDGRGREEIAANGSVLAPGFIDSHTHLDANLFWDPDLTPSSSFGVTTVVTANCGYGLAPIVDDETREYVIDAISSVEQIPTASIHDAVPFDWTDLASYARRLDQLDVLINHTLLIGHVPLRASVMGVPDAYTRPATPEEIDAMCRVLASGLALGALGFSTDQVVGNPGPHGTQLPGQVCGEDELLAIAATLGRGPGPGLFTMANAAMLQGRDDRLADLAWHQRLAKASGKPVVVGPILGFHEDPGGALAVMDGALAGQKTGAMVVPQVSTRPLELWTRLDAPGLLVRSLPSLLAAVRSGGTDGVRALARNPAARQLLRDEGARMLPNSVFSGSWDHVGVRYSRQPGVQGRWLSALAAEQGKDPVDVLLDLAEADNFETQVAIAMRNGDEDELETLVAHTASMIGASDAGAHILSNTDSCYAVWTLQHWVRERGALSLERAVAKLTGDQARLLGFNDRGFVRAGLAADLVLFDPDRVATTAVRFVDDQPLGGRRLVTDATGIEMSIVNGVVATRAGASTGARTGRRLQTAT